MKDNIVQSLICWARSWICPQYMLGVRFVRARHLALLKMLKLLLIYCLELLLLDVNIPHRDLRLRPVTIFSIFVHTFLGA